MQLAIFVMENFNQTVFDSEGVDAFWEGWGLWGVLKMYLLCSKCLIINYWKIGKYQFIDKITIFSGGKNEDQKSN